MPNYDLDRLGDKEFEHLIQAILKKIIGAGTVTFGDGPDGGREATYSGKAPYPSPSEQWEGEWIFQAKFHNTRQIGPDKARTEVLKDLKSELEKIAFKYKRKCDNYILATNVPLSSVPARGTHDKIARDVVPEFLGRIPNIRVWGYDDICRSLDVYADIRQTYLHLITPGDLIAELMDHEKGRKSALAETVRLYVSTSFEKEQYAQLDQAGEIGERQMPLRRVFIDLDVAPRDEKDLRALTRHGVVNRPRHFLESEAFSATEVLNSCDLPKTVLLGGPGQGKSTLGQFVAQIHRAYILDKIDELNGSNLNYTPTVIRVPFRVELKHYAQWIVDSEGPHTLERFLANIVGERAGGQSTSSEQIQAILKQNPTLLILDGLDEVTDSKLRTQMLDSLLEFIRRCEDVLKADLQIIATSRPTGYSDQFDPSRFLHLTLIRMDSDKVLEYTERWIRAKGLESAKGDFLRLSIRDCLADPNFSLLMSTPLQVTIFILIILTGGTPPRQKEELFNEYLEVIYKRERAKSKTIIQTEKRLLFGLHQYIGYLLQRRAAESSETRSRMKDEEFAREVLCYLRHEDPYSDKEELRKKAVQMKEEARSRLVLLVEFDDGLFGFELRPIQEFFAAGWLTDRAMVSEQRFKRFQAIALPPHWRNVALFFAGRAGRCFPGEAAQIMEACREIDRHKPDYFTKRGAWLSLEIASDRSFGPNRVLQRSAIEYALTLLDGDLDREKRSEFISRLHQLPKEDLSDHVVPLLMQRLEKEHLPGEFYTLEVFRSLVEDQLPVQQVMTSALERGGIAPERLLEKALQYHLSPQYIKSKFGEVCAKLQENRIIDLFLPHFVNRPEYVAEIWRDTEFSERVAIPILNAAVESSFGESNRPLGDIRLSVPPDVMDQVKLAWELVTLMRYMRRELGWRYEERLMLRDLLENFVHPGRIPLDLTTEIAQIVREPSAILNLRAIALAFLYKVLLLSPERRLSEEISQEFFSSLNRNQLEVAEGILFRMRVPSLELRHFTLDGRSTEAGILPLHDLRRFIDILSRGDIKIPGSPDLLLHIFVLDPLDGRQCREIVENEWNIKKLPKEFSIDFLRIIVRLGGLRWHAPKDPYLTPEFVATTLNVVFRILEKRGPDEWRVWATLSRLAFFRWSPKSRRSSRGGREELKRILHSLCKALEGRIDAISGRWEIGGVIMRSARVDGLEDIVLRLLKILGQMPESRVCSRISHAFHPRRFEPGAVKKLLEIAIA